MSIEQPDALALLDIARETLLEKVLPQLEGDARYQTLMIANAMAMAMRELGSDETGGELETQLLRSLYLDCPVPGDEAAGQTVLRLQDLLTQDLRDATLDVIAQPALRQLLRTRTEARLKVSNPRRWAREVGDSGNSAEAREGESTSSTD